MSEFCGKIDSPHRIYDLNRSACSVAHFFHRAFRFLLTLAYACLRSCSTAAPRPQRRKGAKRNYLERLNSRVAVPITAWTRRRLPRCSRVQINHFFLLLTELPVAYFCAVFKILLKEEEDMTINLTIILTIGTLVSCGTAASAQYATSFADAEPYAYCLQGGLRGFPGICDFSSFQQCQATAPGITGLCIRNPMSYDHREFRRKSSTRL